MGVDKNSLIRNCVVEFVGDLIFIFIGTMQATAGGGVIAAAAAHGITIAVLIGSMGHISGGHFNPAVTLGIFLTGNIPVVNALLYILSQLSGGFVGSLLARAAVTEANWIAIGGGATIPAILDINIFQGILVEAIMTFLLVNTVLISAVDTGTNMLAPFCIGLSIFVDILAGGNVTGASMNPARTFGPSIVGCIFPIGTRSSFEHQYIYWAGQTIGASIAAVFYKAFLAKEESRWLLK
jgi:MIP family channel proteins